MAIPGQTYSWWDRDCDFAGRRIRQDVRIAAQQLWEEACRRTDAVLFDRALAADLMERAVTEISRYLDRIGATTTQPKHRLLWIAFCRSLRRHAGKMRRLELVGGSSELAVRTIDEAWIPRLHARLDLDKILLRLSARNQNIFMLRAAGFKWPEIAVRAGASEAAVRNGFWREINKIRAKI